MDQTNYPGPPTLFHVRVNALFFVLWAIDTVMFVFAVESTLTHGVGGMVLFASEVRPCSFVSIFSYRLEGQTLDCILDRL